MLSPENDLSKTVVSSQMKNIVPEKTSFSNNPFDLIEIIKILWRSKVFIISFSSLFSVAIVIYALSLPDIYKSRALLAPVTAEGSSGASSQLGGLASLAGINLSSSSTNKTTLALAILKSRSFIEGFIEKYNLLPQLLAAESWDKNKQDFIYNSSIFDSNKNTWLFNNETKSIYKPSLWEAYKKFSEMLIVVEDPNTSLYSIYLEHYSPKHTQEWLGLLIAEINNYMRIEDELEAEASIKYLSTKLTETKLKNMEMVFYQLIEEQNKKLMLTQVKKEYVLKTIESAQMPEEKVKPKRSMLVIFGSFFGLVLAMFISLLYHVIKEYKK